MCHNYLNWLVDAHFSFSLKVPFIHHMSLCHFSYLVSASQDGKLIVWDCYTTNKVSDF